MLDVKAAARARAQSTALEPSGEVVPFEHTASATRRGERLLERRKQNGKPMDW